MGYTGATADDIALSGLETVQYGQWKGWKNYRLDWTTYRGWRAYMYMTGIIACDLKYELVDV